MEAPPKYKRPQSARSSGYSPPPPPKDAVWFDRNWAAVEMNANWKTVEESKKTLKQSEATVENLRNQLADKEAELAAMTASCKYSEAALAMSRDSQAAHEAQLKEKQAAHEAQLKEKQAAHEAKLKESLAAREAELIRDLESAKEEVAHLKAEQALLTGKLEEVNTASREASRQLFARQIARQIASRECFVAFASWQAFCESKTYALKRLRQAAKRLRMAEVAHAFRELVAERNEARLSAERTAHVQEQAALRHEVETQQAATAQLQENMQERVKEIEAQAEGQALAVAEVESLRQELAALRAEMQEQAEVAKSKVDELNLAREKELMEIAAAEKEAKRELFRQQVVRRLHYRDLNGGFQAWLELWTAKTYSLKRLRECANRINPRSKDLAEAFYFWVSDVSEEGRKRQLQGLEKRADKMMAIIAIRDKEIKRLKVEVEKLKPREDGMARKQRELREKQRRKLGKVTEA